MTEIPEEAVLLAADAIQQVVCGTVARDVPDEREYCEDAARAVLALPHLRVQETPDCPHAWEEINPGHWMCKELCGTPDVDLTRSPDWSPPAPRPVVDREALAKVMHEHGVGAWTITSSSEMLKHREQIIDAILALLPTEEAPVYVVHHHDIEKTAEHFNQGYDEAQRQRIGGPESRNWLTEKVWPLLKDHIDPENSHQVADHIADALLSEADMTDLPTEENTKALAETATRLGYELGKAEGREEALAEVDGWISQQQHKRMTTTKWSAYIDVAAEIGRLSARDITKGDLT